MTKENSSRKEEILQAALAEFIKEGISGARLQAIADNIGVTKAMIHYYFDTKENLFREAFRVASETLMDGLLEVLEQPGPLFQKIETFIDRTLDRFGEKPELTSFIVNELNQHAEITEPIFRQASSYNASAIEKQIEDSASNYEIAPVQQGQVVSNMLALCMFPYCGRGFLQSVLSIEDETSYNQFLNNRREVIKDTIINWLAG